MSSFDDRAATWDEPHRVERARASADAIHERVPLTGSERLLEYGAGTGLLAAELAPHVGAVTVADPSAGMREVMRAKVDNGALPASTRVWDLDLTAGSAPEESFDLVATVMTLHHIPDVAAVLRGFVRLLEPGGHVCIVDLVAEDGSFHREEFHGHHGFDIDELSGQLRNAGFVDVDVRVFDDVLKDGVAYPLFLATARRPPGGR